jgi:hypothetical protein
MASESKYYYITYPSSVRELPEVMKWNESFTLAVEENVDFRQVIDLSINKLANKNSVKPVSDKHKKVKPIITEIFLNHYTLALKFIHETDIDDGEFYLSKKSSDWYIIEYYSKNEKERRKTEIDFRDSIEELWLRFSCTPGFNSRPYSRKKASPITGVQFKQFLNLTIQFLYDSDSLTTFLNDYLKNFYRLCEGDTKIEGFIISAEKSFQIISAQLTSRKEYLEKRLIENDADSTLDRMKFRGELEGILYAMNVINANK